MADPTVMSFTLRDELGTEASALVYIDYDGAVETVDGLTGQWAHYGGLLDAATSAQIVGGKITIPFGPAGGWKSAPAAGSRVEQNAIVNMTTTETSKRQGFSIPSLINTAIVAGKVVTGSGPVHALILDLLAGFTNGNYANGVGQGLNAFSDAFISFRKHRRQLQRSSEVFVD